MKKIIFAFLILMLCILSFMLISCDGLDTTTESTTANNITYEYKITYELNGGTNSENNPTEFKTGDIVSLDFPTKENYMFAGWYTDSEFTTDITEIKDIKEDLTLYARWASYEDIFEFSEYNGGYRVTIAPKYVVSTIIIPTEYKNSPVIRISGTATEYHKMFKNVAIPESVLSIAMESFSSVINDKVEMALECIIVDPNNPNYKSEDGVLYSKDGKILIRYHASKSDKSFIMPEGVTTVESFAFSDNENLESITIPNSVLSIGRCVFIRNTALKNVKIPDSVMVIGYSAFSGCTSLKNATLSNKMETISLELFYNCSSLESIIIPDSVKTIGNWAFYNCSSLNNIVVPKNVIELYDNTFRGCSQLTVYCQANSSPNTWDALWTYYVKEVIWGYKGE